MPCCLMNIPQGEGLLQRGEDSQQCHAASGTFHRKPWHLKSIQLLLTRLMEPYQWHRIIINQSNQASSSSDVEFAASRGRGGTFLKHCTIRALQPSTGVGNHTKVYP